MSKKPLSTILYYSMKEKQFKSVAVYDNQGNLLGQTIDINKLFKMKSNKFKPTFKPKKQKPKMILPKGTNLKAIKSTPFPKESKFRLLETTKENYLVLVVQTGLSYPYSPEVFEKTFEPIKIKIIYGDDESGEIKEMEVFALNCFEGANISGLQILKSAAGYYIGALCKADWYEKKESKDKDAPEEFWEPNYRDSQYYWRTREEAEIAFLSGKYEVKF